MPRTGSSATLAAIAAGLASPALFVSIASAASTLYLWTGLGPLTWGGTTWTGAGPFAGVGTIEEGSTVQAKGIVLSLNGVPSSIVALVMQDLRINMPAMVYLGALNPNGTLVDTPILAFAGYVDEPDIEDSAETCTISISVEDVLIDLNRSVYRRYTNDDQQIDYPTDTSMRYVVGIQEQTTYWGVLPNSYNNR